MKHLNHLLSLIVVISCHIGVSAQSFNGLDMGLGNIFRVSNAESRSISPENFTGEKGKGGMAVPDAGNPTRNVNNSSFAAQELGQGWKVNPNVRISSGETFTMAEIDGPGAIQHIWITPQATVSWRFLILRIYWDDEKNPSVEVPLGDFFCLGWDRYTPVVSMPVCVNPGRGFNSYWPMPFRKKCRMTLENINDVETKVFYQVDYTLTDVPDDAAYFHAQFRRTLWNETSDFTVIDGIKGQGQFVGVFLALGVHNNRWWGEGEVKFFIDGDKKFPTICGTGLEDYFCGSYDFSLGDRSCHEFCSPYAGLCQVIQPDGTFDNSQGRYGMYRWHIMDPVRFKKDLRVTVQDLGWKRDRHYLPQHSDIASTVFWYQLEPHAKFPVFPGKESLEIF